MHHIGPVGANLPPEPRHQQRVDVGTGGDGRRLDPVCAQLVDERLAAVREQHAHLHLDARRGERREQDEQVALGATDTARLLYVEYLHRRSKREGSHHLRNLAARRGRSGIARPRAGALPARAGPPGRGGYGGRRARSRGFLSRSGRSAAIGRCRCGWPRRGSQVASAARGKDVIYSAGLYTRSSLASRLLLGPACVQAGGRPGLRASAAGGVRRVARGLPARPPQPAHPLLEAPAGVRAVSCGARGGAEPLLGGVHRRLGGARG